MNNLYFWPLKYLGWGIAVTADILTISDSDLGLSYLHPTPPTKDIYIHLVLKNLIPSPCIKSFNIRFSVFPPFVEEFDKVTKSDNKNPSENLHVENEKTKISEKSEKAMKPKSSELGEFPLVCDGCHSPSSPCHLLSGILE